MLVIDRRQVRAWLGAALLCMASTLQAAEPLFLNVAPGASQSWPVGLASACSIGSTLTDVIGPRHGTLETTGTTTTYRPGPSFWSLGLDSLRYSVVRGAQRTTCTAWLLAKARPQGTWLEPRGAALDARLSPQGGGSPGAGSGLKIKVPPPPGGGRLPEPDPLAAPAGGTPDGGIGFAEPTPDPGDEDPDSLVVGESLLVSAGGEDDAQDVELWIEPAEQGANLWIRAAGQASERVAVRPGLRSVDLEWWAPPCDTCPNDGGVLLLVDGQAHTLLRAPVSRTWRFRVHEDSTTMKAVVRSADFRPGDAKDATQPLLRDDFDGARGVPWRDLAGPMTVLGDAGLLGGDGLRLAWGNALSDAWLADLPAPGPTLGIGFWMRSNPGSSGSLELLSVYTERGGAGQRLFRLVVEQQAGGSVLRALVKDETGALHTLTAAAVPQGEAVRVDVQWCPSDGERPDTGGWLRLWVDGQPQADVVALAVPSTLAAQSLRLGPLATPEGMGSIDVDGFEVWR